MRAALLLLLASGCGLKNRDHLEHQLEREVVALKMVKKDLQVQLAHCADEDGPNGMYSELVQVFKGTEATVWREGSVVVVSVPVGLLFGDPWSMRFRVEAEMTMDLLATALKLHEDQQILIEGHTDNAGLPPEARAYDSHLHLSLAYAEAVQARLSADFGVEAKRFTVAGRGSWAPIASNDLPHGQSRNRRVVIRVRPAIGGL